MWLTMWSMFGGTSFASEPPEAPLVQVRSYRRVDAWLAGVGLGAAGAAVPLVPALAIGDGAAPAVGAGLAGVGLVAGSALGSHLVARGPLGRELAGSLGGAAVGSLTATVGVAVGLAFTLPYADGREGVQPGPRGVAIAAVGLGGLGLLTLPALGSTLASGRGSRRQELAFGPVVVPADGGVRPGLGVTIGPRS